MCNSWLLLHEKRILTLRKKWGRRLGKRGRLTPISADGSKRLKTGKSGKYEERQKDSRSEDEEKVENGI